MRSRKALLLHQLFPLFVLIMIIMSGCTSPASISSKCTIMFEDNSSLYIPKQLYKIEPSSELTVSIGLPHGYRISSVNYEDYSVSAKTGESESFDYYDLTLHHVRYSSLIRLTTDVNYTTDYYDASGLILASLTEDSPHIRFNSLAYHEISDFSGSGNEMPIGWNTSADGTGEHIGFGSRYDHSDASHKDLYLETLPCTPSSAFTYTRTGSDEIMITGYRGTGDIVIPPYIEGLPVTTIAADTFLDLTIEQLVLPYTLRSVAPHAFGNVTVRDFYFFDSTTSIPEDAFLSYNIAHLHINAATSPVYSGSYFDTLSDKVDYLYSLRDEKKIVLFCGSSARFGYDSPTIESACPDYKVINMGVYAYSNMFPQAKIVQSYMKSDDILLSSPELDAIDMQFCRTPDLDKETFCMMESNYDMLAVLDCSDFTNVFSAYSQYSDSRAAMEPKSYSISPSTYDEDGNPTESYTYNRYGDYIAYRRNNEEKISFGIKRAYYNSSYITNQDLSGINQVYDSFHRMGVRVLFTYSPRSKISISEDSTNASIQKLDVYLRENLHADIISSIDDSLMDPFYFYGTDNHLSTNGVTLHTQQIINDLQVYMEEQ